MYFRNKVIAHESPVLSKHDVFEGGGGGHSYVTRLNLVGFRKFLSCNNGSLVLIQECAMTKILPRASNVSRTDTLQVDSSQFPVTPLRNMGPRRSNTSYRFDPLQVSPIISASFYVPLLQLFLRLLLLPCPCPGGFQFKT